MEQAVDLANRATCPSHMCEVRYILYHWGAVSPPSNKLWEIPRQCSHILVKCTSNTLDLPILAWICRVSSSLLRALTWCGPAPRPEVSGTLRSLPPAWSWCWAASRTPGCVAACRCGCEWARPEVSAGSGCTSRSPCCSAFPRPAGSPLVTLSVMGHWGGRGLENRPILWL